MKKLKIIFMGKDKYSTITALEYLLTKKIKISIIIGSKKHKSDDQNKSLKEFARKNQIKFFDDAEIYKKIKANKKFNFLEEVDLIISFLYWKKIKPSLIKLSRLGCINFHPAILPEYRGVGGYNLAIMHRLSQWGVSAHFIDEGFDTGDIIKVNRFKIKSDKETALSLEAKTQIKLLVLFDQIINMLLSEKKIPRIKQLKTKGKYFSKKDFEKLREINSNDSIKMINRKISAFWFPPFAGAYIKIKNQEFTIINQKILDEINNKSSK